MVPGIAGEEFWALAAERHARAPARQRVRGRLMPETLFMNLAQLRARALRLREMAEEFPGEEMERHLLKLAAAFDARADALERQG
jgi:hypothetical protein